MKTPAFEVTISGIASGGDGIAQHRGHNLFIPFTIPGEVLTVQITGENERFTRAEGVQMVEPSADRVIPECMHFGPHQCGGCQWQHMNYEAQLALKTDILLDNLERIGGFNPDKLRFKMPIPAPQIWGYRTRADFVPTGEEGALGFWSNGGRYAIPIEECLISHPRIMELVDELNLTIDNLSQLTVQVSTNGDAMLVIRTTDEDVPELESEFPLSINFLLNDNVPINLVGKTHIVQTLLDRSFRITAGVSFRDYPAQHEHLVQEVLKRLKLQGDESVLDLYGGVGVFSAFLAPLVEYVAYVDSYPPAATDAEENLAEFENVDVIEGGAEDVLVDMFDDESYFDIAIIDPPHSGMSHEAMTSLLALKIPLLFYISLDAISLARDAKYLVQKGYRLRELQPLDFAPQTYHLQTLAVFELK